MSDQFITVKKIQNFPLWHRIREQRSPLSFDLELTARCSQNCRHCYINLPANDRKAQAEELTIEEIEHIAEQAVNMGAIWCLITGGDPLLRPDFADIYLMLKRKGLLITVFTAATLINQEHIDLFKKYPPRDIEVTVYGASQETYERVTRWPDSFNRFKCGLDLLLQNNINVRLKAMALRSNLDEMEEISRFCRQRTKDYFRYDPQLHLRLDGNQERNNEIRAERLTPEEIVELEHADRERFQSLEKNCDTLVVPRNLSYSGCMDCPKHPTCEQFTDFCRLFQCGAGTNSFSVSYNGLFRLCASLCAPETTCDLRKVSLCHAWVNFVPQIRALNKPPELLATCGSCTYVNLCSWCPAHAHLETGQLEGSTPYFCAVAHTRAASLKKSLGF